jgi:hypothetical protein
LKSCQRSTPNSAHRSKFAFDSLPAALPCHAPYSALQAQDIPAATATLNAFHSDFVALQREHEALQSKMAGNSASPSLFHFVTRPSGQALSVQNINRFQVRSLPRAAALQQAFVFLFLSNSVPLLVARRRAHCAGLRRPATRIREAALAENGCRGGTAGHTAGCASGPCNQQPPAAGRGGFE